MTRNDYIGMLLFALGCSLVGFLIGISVGNGILVGALFGFIHYTLLRQFYTFILSAQSFRMGLFALYFLGNFGIFAVPLYIGCVYPDFVNVFGAAFGLTIHNLFIYSKTLLQSFSKRKER